MGRQKLPLGKGTAEKVVVKYPSEGGYTPGDTWDLYIGSDKRVQEFAYHRGGAGQPKTHHRTMGRLQEGWPPSYLNEPPREGKPHHTVASLLFRCIRQARRLRYLVECAVTDGPVIPVAAA
jgi:hypothetical protein